MVAAASSRLLSEGRSYLKSRSLGGEVGLGTALTLPFAMLLTPETVNPNVRLSISCCVRHKSLAMSARFMLSFRSDSNTFRRTCDDSGLIGLGSDVR
jgi:hypothetical protein